MIPLRLELTNFLSYRDTAVLDFNGIHLACISGANGAGKSTILDAMTWALFGQSRSRSDEDLINKVAALNGDGAEISFIFQLENSVLPHPNAAKKRARRPSWNCKSRPTKTVRSGRRSAKAESVKRRPPSKACCG